MCRGGGGVGSSVWTKQRHVRTLWASSSDARVATSPSKSLEKSISFPFPLSFRWVNYNSPNLYRLFGGCIRLLPDQPPYVFFFFPPVGFKGNLSLLDIFFVPGVLTKWKLWPKQATRRDFALGPGRSFRRARLRAAARDEGQQLRPPRQSVAELAREPGEKTKVLELMLSWLLLGNMLHFCLLWFSGKSPLDCSKQVGCGCQNQSDPILVGR